MANFFMTFSEFSDNLVDKDGEDSTVSCYGILDDDFEAGNLFLKHDDKMLPIEFIERNGGGEGGGEQCETILRVGDFIVRISYQYYSHHGYSYDYADVHIVTPIEKTITVYE